MDSIKFLTENNEYLIEVTKRKKLYSTSQYAQYICNINFINSIGDIVLSIECSEIELLQMLFTIDYFIYQKYEIISDNIYFTSSPMNSYFIYISQIDYIPNYTNINNENIDYMQMSIYKVDEMTYKNALCIYLEMSYIFLEEIEVNIAKVLEDIPYLNAMSDSLQEKNFY